jgi:hypothetical protein
MFKLLYKQSFLFGLYNVTEHGSQVKFVSRKVQIVNLTNKINSNNLNFSI